MFPDTDEETGPIVPPGVHLAPIGRRVVGLLIDQAVVAVPVFVAFAVAGYPPQDALADDAGWWFTVAVTALALVYDTLGVWRWGRTVGKVVTGTRVVHVLDGGSVAFSSSLIRALVPAAFGVIPDIGTFLGFGVYLLAFFDRRRQGLHDKAAGTLVAITRRG